MQGKYPFLAHQDKDRNLMLKSMGLESINELFKAIPKEYLLKKELNLPKPLEEWELLKHINQKIKLNQNCCDLISCLGGGVYDHYVPAIVDSIASRGEFLTAYTPYQPEMSQGFLKALKNFSEKISLITSLPTVTCSHYDGATALAEAAWMAVSNLNTKSIIVSEGLFPQYKKVLETYCYARDVKIVYLPILKDKGTVDFNSLKSLELDNFAALIIQSPNCVGVVEKLKYLEVIKQESKIKIIGSIHPYLSVISKVNDSIFDIITLEGQSLGLNMFAGGAHLGILACTEDLRHLTPGRLIGEVCDIYGEPSLALVFEDREQHVARDRATSNICSNQALNALKAGIFIDLLGFEGISEIYSICNTKAKSLKKALTSLDNVKTSYSGDIFNEFTVSFSSTELLVNCVEFLKDKGIILGITSSIFESLSDNEVLIAVTETTSDSDLEIIVREVCLAMNLDPEAPLEILNSHLIKYREISEINNQKSYKNLESCPEHKVIRKYTNWSRNNFGVDTGSYPLGSCTMKYNPKRNDFLAERIGFQKLHPYQPLETLEGIKEIYRDLQKYIGEILGMDNVDLTPAAGAHGELKGLLIARKYFEERGESHRNEVIIPDSAHGTNPATAKMVGYICKIIPTREDGLMDADALKNSLSKNTAVVMTTNPSTFGIFEEEIGKIVSETHKFGALMYYDGANMNALMGITNPGIMGFDIAHLNVHKTLGTPHGGGGPGAGPVGVKKFLSKYIDKGFSDYKNLSPTNIKLFNGHLSVLLRAYCYIRSMGPIGLKKASQDAVLNANYLRHKLRESLPSVFETNCMHEVLLDGNNLPIKILDLAKRMIDFNVHPPTLVGAGCVYFGKELSNSMLFEPTESETKDELDKLIEIIETIIDEAYRDKSIAENAPLKGETSRILIK